ncbi:hypothetical protein ACFRCG_23870 [Embleya sp. NPDC056575]|uniref:hypothetical protein n=1 Tax=unclassified Embleya TaxID=2699296 RepID=UPI00369F9B5C
MSDPTVHAPGADADPVPIAALHRRIAETTGNLRAADQKASILLAAAGLAAASGSDVDQSLLSVATVVSLGTTAVLLALVLVPRGALSVRAGRDAEMDLVLRVVDAAERPRALTRELTELSEIATRKYSLIRAALFQLAVTAVLFGIARVL